MKPANPGREVRNTVSDAIDPQRGRVDDTGDDNPIEKAGRKNGYRIAGLDYRDPA